jgi:hypothetical protein
LLAFGAPVGAAEPAERPALAAPSPRAAFLPPPLQDLTADRIRADSPASLGSFGAALANAGFVADALGKVLTGALPRARGGIGGWSDAVGA